MTNKRDHDSLSYSDAEDSPATQQQSNKRQRKQDKSNNHKRNQNNNGQPGIDPTYGQRSAIPVEYPSDDDIEFEDQSDALAYLHAVQ
jgi:hypothetical protein